MNLSNFLNALLVNRFTSLTDLRKKKKITYMRQIKQQNDTLYFIINWPYYVTAYSNLQH